VTEPLLAGRVAVVTGAGRGIGRSHALRMAAYGARVVVNDPGVAMDGSPTDETPAQEVVGEIVAAGGEAVADLNDIATMEGGQAVVDLALSTWGRVDIVVNNAGIGRPRMVFNLEEQDWDDVVRVHLKGMFAVSRPACRWWRSEAKAGRGGYGRLVNTATGLLHVGGAGQSNYVAAKAGCAAFTAAVATEMAPYGVTANAILPGARTRLANVGWRIGRMAAEKEAFDSASPDWVAELVCYLASPAAGWVSGQCFDVRGGLVQQAVAWSHGAALERDDDGWTALDLVTEMPRLFGAGPHRSDPPPADWQQRYHSGEVGIRPT
jgi:NAD(P)-dependent dehydrogenase (short-subunit alcohol dehydrogenase family)